MTCEYLLPYCTASKHLHVLYKMEIQRKLTIVAQFELLYLFLC